MAVTHPRLTAEEYEALQLDRGWSVPAEHLDGEVVVTPPVYVPHGYAHAELTFALRDWQRDTGDGGLVLVDTFVLIGGDTLAPDLGYWRADRRPPIVRSRADATPDLVVEIASPTTVDNDVGPKRRAYVAAGVREQWLIDPIGRSAVIVDAADHEVRLDDRARLTSTVLPGFSLALASLFG